MQANNFKGQDLRGRSFKNQDLTGADFSDCDLRGVDFSFANLTDVKFCNARIGKTFKHKLIIFFLQILSGWATGFIAVLFSAIIVFIMKRMIFFLSATGTIGEGNHYLLLVLSSLFYAFGLSFVTLSSILKKIGIILYISFFLLRLYKVCFYLLQKT